MDGWALRELFRGVRSGGKRDFGDEHCLSINSGIGLTSKKLGLHEGKEPHLETGTVQTLARGTDKLCLF